MTGELRTSQHIPYRVKVAIASKLRHASKFVELRRAEQGNVYITSRWPIAAGMGSEALRPTHDWLSDNFADIERCDFLLVYVEDGEHLKGGLIEVGYAVAHGKRVFLAGQHEDYSHYQHDRTRFERCHSIQDAVDRMKNIARIRAGGEP